MEPLETLSIPSRQERGLEALRELFELVRLVSSNRELAEFAQAVADDRRCSGDGAQIFRLAPWGEAGAALLHALGESDDVLRDLRARMEKLSLRDVSKALEVTPGARRFRAPGGTWQDLGRRQSNRRVLAALVARHGLGESGALSVGAIFELGWVGQRIRSDSMSNRVHVAMCDLRKRGLKAILLNTKAGYFLDPRVPVIEVPC